MKELIEQFIKDWTPLGMEEITEGEFKRDVHKLIQAACQKQNVRCRATYQINRTETSPVIKDKILHTPLIKTGLEGK